MQQFDLLIGGGVDRCSSILADFLDVPVIYFQITGFSALSETYFPYIPSWMCSPETSICVSDQMSFYERLRNTLLSVAFESITVSYANHLYDDIRQKCNIVAKTRHPKGISIAVLDFRLEYPRPLMPHMKAIGYIFARSQPFLPEFYQDLVKHSDGVILVSFGTLVPSFDKRKANMFARVFARFSQTVLWKYTGNPPKELEANTHLVDWFPQEDLLAHPNTKLFITYCGQASVYETAHSGVPVVAIPLFFDQFYNAAKLATCNKVGVVLNMENLSEEKLESIINEVLTNTEYTDNAKRLQQALSQQLVDPKEELLYWVKYAMVNQNVDHLISWPAYNMSWFQYFLFDVFFIMFLLSVTSLFILWKLLSISSKVWKYSNQYILRIKNKTD